MKKDHETEDSASRAEGALPFLLSDRDGAKLCGFSRQTWWRRVHDGTLPQPIRLGGSTRWRSDEVLAAIARASAERDRGAA